MAVTGKTIIEKAALYIEDTEFDLFTREEVLRELNSVQREHISTSKLGYVRRSLVELVEGQTIYQFPGDMIRLSHAYIKKPSATIKTIVTERYMENEPVQGDELAIYRERVSGNEFEFLPEIDVDNLASGLTGNVTRGKVPDTAVEYDIWVDEEGVIHWCSSEYSTGSTTMTVTTGRTVPLVFLATETGAYIEVEFIDGGASGVSSLAKSGSGTYEDPYVYEFTLFDDDADNDAIIALLSGDADLSASGSDATAVSVTAFGQTPLTRTHESNFTTYSLELHYKAELPDFYSEDDELHPSVGNPMRTGDAVAKLVAANLLLYSKGNMNQAQAYRAEGLAMLSEAAFLERKPMRPIGLMGRRLRR